MVDTLSKYPQEIVDKVKKIKLLLLDVDGVLSDGRMIYGSYGDDIKNYNVNDGLGIMMIRRVGFKCAILTAKASRMVMRRAKDLKIDKVFKDYHYKSEAWDKILKTFKVNPEEICFIGDDVLDIPILRRVGFAVCPPNAMDEAKEHAHLITEKKGGHGAVREICDLILKAQNKWEETTKRYYE